VRLSAWWNCVLGEAHAATVTWTPVVSLREGAPPPGSRAGSGEITNAAARVRDLEARLEAIAESASLPQKPPPSLQSELLELMLKYDSLEPRVV
jgi:hypothetical protein